MTPAAFWSRVSGGSVQECWIWNGFRTPKGYGLISTRRDGRSTTVRAHRVAYEELIHQIPEGLEIDHLCRNTSCVNPWHLEPVPKRVNQQRTASDYCRRGHLNPDRYCRLCRAERYQRLKLAA